MTIFNSTVLNFRLKSCIVPLNQIISHHYYSAFFLTQRDRDDEIFQDIFSVPTTFSHLLLFLLTFE